MSYQALAAVYDLLMEDIDYQQWADYIHSLLEEQHCPGKRLLDLGCGTGSITMLLAQKGYCITAVDLSADMLAQARRKNQTLNLPIRWEQQDMTELFLEDDGGEPSVFDGVIATFDAVNYITDAEQLQHLLQSLEFMMADDGILIFDIQTPYKLREYLGDNIFTLHHPQVEYMWENHFDQEEQICQMDITFFLKQENGLYQRVTESHREKAYELDLLRVWLDLYGFEVIAVYGELSRQPVGEQDHRAVFVARHRSWEEQTARADAFEDDDMSFCEV